MTGREIVFAVVDDRAVEQVFQEQRRCAAAAVGDNQVGFQVGSRAQGIEDALALLEIHPIDLGPGNAFLRPVLGRQRKLVQLELLEHLGRGRGTAREALDQEAALPAMYLFSTRGRAGRTGRGRRRGGRARAWPLSPSPRGGERREPLGKHWARQTSCAVPRTGPARPPASPSGRCSARLSRTASAWPVRVVGFSNVRQKSRLAVADDLAVRCRVRGQHDASRGHRLQQRSRHGIRPAGRKMQVARGQHLARPRPASPAPETRVARDRPADPSFAKLGEDNPGC